MDKLNGDFNRGYTKALLDVNNWIENHSDTLKMNKMFNQKGIKLLLKTFLKYREQMRETGEYTPFVVNKDKTDMWFFDKN